MKILVDMGVGRGVELWLANTGYDVKSVRETDPRAEDTEIIKMAEHEKRLILTMDKDFGGIFGEDPRKILRVPQSEIENKKIMDAGIIVRERDE
jgi:predicted nuclease of predicted toxin-antitoxin system